MWLRYKYIFIIVLLLGIVNTSFSQIRKMNIIRKKHLSEVSIKSNALKYVLNKQIENHYYKQKNSYIQIRLKEIDHDKYHVYVQCWERKDRYLGFVAGAKAYGMCYYKGIPLFFIGDYDDRIIEITKNKTYLIRHYCNKACVWEDRIVLFPIFLDREDEEYYKNWKYDY